ncbi:MAG: AI-2E family transporter, partial [Chloroflexota bacterium]
VDLHPAVVILSLIVGASLFGLSGAILAAPVVALGRDLYRYAFRRLEGGAPDDARAFASHARSIPPPPTPPPEAEPA